MALTRSQEAILQRVNRPDYPPLSDLELAEVPGFHFCPDWDFLPICWDSPEAESCTCPRSAEAAAAGGGFDPFNQ